MLSATLEFLQVLKHSKITKKLPLIIPITLGPYYKYRTYWDMLHSTESYKTSYLNHALQRAKRLPLYTILFMIGSHYFPLSVIKHSTT